MSEKKNRLKQACFACSIGPENSGRAFVELESRRTNAAKILDRD